MKNRQKLSVNIITYNEEANIQDALESVQWADEIVVLDSFSKDRTVEICRKYTDRIISHDFVGYGKLRNLVIDQSSYDWILSLDSDERVTPELKDEILRELEKGPSADGFSIPRKSHFLGHWVKYCGWYPDYRSMQLFHRTKGRYTEVLNDDHLELLPGGRRGFLKGHILHYTYHDLDQYLRKMERYTTLKSQQMLKDGRKYHVHQLLTHPAFTFIKMYLVRQGFRDGHIGLILSFLYTYYTFVKYAKLWELTRQPDDSEEHQQDKGSGGT
jgi:glycosyltransferase involved in cell wall biosynthesis